MKNVCIIGGGITGLSAAHALAEAGDCAVTLAEREPRLGGLAITLQREGMSADLGPHRINTELPEVQALLEELAGGWLMRVPRQSRMRLGGRYVDYPIRPLELARALGPLTPARCLASFLWHAAFGKSAPEPSFEAHMIDAFGPALYRLLFAPYIEKTWKTPPAELSAEIARVRLSVGGLKQTLAGLFKRRDPAAGGALQEFHYLQGGIERLIELFAQRAQAAGATLQTESVLEGFVLEDDRIAGVRLRHRDETVQLAPDAIVSTVPLHVLVPLLLAARENAEAKAALERLRYLALTLVYIVVRRERIGKDTWLYFPGADIVFNRAYEAKNFDPSLGPADRTILCCEITGLRGAEWPPEDELVERTVADVTRTGLFGRDEIETTFTHRLEWAYPLYHRGFQDDLARVCDYLRTFPSLISTGRQGLFNHNNMDHCIAMGRAAARCAQEHDAPAAPWYDGRSQFDHFRIVD